MQETIIPMLISVRLWTCQITEVERVMQSTNIVMLTGILAHKLSFICWFRRLLQYKLRKEAMHTLSADVSGNKKKLAGHWVANVKPVRKTITTPNLRRADNCSFVTPIIGSTKMYTSIPKLIAVIGIDR